MTDTTLQGRAALVTGGGGGLGQAIALALAEAGADVAVAGRTPGRLEATAEQIQKLGRKSAPITADVTQSGQVRDLVSGVVNALGGLDILVNNSGVLANAPLLETTDDAWDRVVDTNLRGTFLCTREAGRIFTEQRRGKVITIASNFAYMGVANFASYCASKAALVAFTRAIGIEWSGLGVQVNAIAPGYFATEINADVRADETLTERIVRQIPVRRMGKPGELGPLSVYLASSASDFMTGETILLDGGQAAR